VCPSTGCLRVLKLLVRILWYDCGVSYVAIRRFEVYALNSGSGAISLQILPSDVQQQVVRRLGASASAGMLAEALIALVNNATFVSSAPTTWFRRLFPASIVIVPSNAPAPSPHPSDDRNVMIGGIVGGVGGGFLLVLIVFGLIRRRYRRKQGLSEALEMTEGVALDYVLAHEE
jgi:hypothetical protein